MLGVFIYLCEGLGTLKHVGCTDRSWLHISLYCQSFSASFKFVPRVLAVANFRSGMRLNQQV